MKEKLFAVGQRVRVIHFNYPEPPIGEVIGYTEQIDGTETSFLVMIRLEDGVTLRVGREYLVRPL